MSLVISKEAAVYLSRQIAKDPALMPQPLRLSINKGLGCGDVGHTFSFGANFREGDVQVELEGLTVLCNINDCPEFENAAIVMVKSPVGLHLATEKVVVIPDGAHLCGCGESATMPKKT